MFLREEISKYLHYCKFQKELDDKTIKAYKQKTVKRKIVSEK